MEPGMLVSIAITASPSFAGIASSLALIAHNLSIAVKVAADKTLDHRDRKQASHNPAGGKP